MATYRWENFARTISGNAKYLYEPTQTAKKAISLQGLGKTNGNIAEGFNFTFTVVPVLKTDITFSSRCFNDKENEITAQTITVKSCYRWMRLYFAKQSQRACGSARYCLHKN